MFPSTDPQSALLRPYAILRIFRTCNKGGPVLHCANSDYRASVTNECIRRLVSVLGSIRSFVGVAALLCLLTPVAATGAPTTSSYDVKIQSVEALSGGRLGVALIDARGRRLFRWRGDERFAMCSTFKAPLAAQVLAMIDAGELTLDRPVYFGAADLLDYAPVVRAHSEMGVLPVAELARAAVTVSDNSAANLLLRITGGPESFTAFVRRQGDQITRLDRIEPALNSNDQGDPRDTTSPVAMAGLMRRMLSGALTPGSTATLRRWLEETSTGAKRIRAGLPGGWRAGDKTGTCGNAWNDVAIIRTPKGRDYLLAVYLDRATVGAERADGVLAEVARILVPLMARR